jgi:GH18 family chitinase
MRELRERLGPDRLLTAAVAAVEPGASGIGAEIFDTVDFLNVMAYDGSGGQHSPMSYAQEALTYWADRGLAANKTVLGVPFYSRPAEVAYRELVEADPAAAEADEIDYYGTIVNYNGRATIAEKTQLALDAASGLMIWTVLDDTADETSLLRAVHAVLAEAGVASGS